MPRKRKTHKQKILNFLGSGKQLTTRYAQSRLGVNRVSARIYDLREDGWVIFTNAKTVNGRRVFQYRLSTDQQGVASLF